MTSRLHYCNSDLEIKPYGLKKLHMREDTTECLLSKVNCHIYPLKGLHLDIQTSQCDMRSLPLCLGYHFPLHGYDLSWYLYCSETMKLIERRRKCGVEDAQSSQKPHQNFRFHILVTKCSRNCRPASELMAQCKTHFNLSFHSPTQMWIRLFFL